MKIATFDAVDSSYGGAQLQLKSYYRADRSNIWAIDLSPMVLVEMPQPF